MLTILLNIHLVLTPLVTSEDRSLIVSVAFFSLGANLRDSAKSLTLIERAASSCLVRLQLFELVCLFLSRFLRTSSTLARNSVYKSSRSIKNNGLY